MKKAPFFLCCFIFILPLLGWGQCDAQIFFIDIDGDGFGNLEYTEANYDAAWDIYEEFQEIDIPYGNVIVSCSKPEGYAFSANDLDDNNSCITNISPQYFYLDSDGDGFGNSQNFIYCSLRPSGYVQDRTECDDTDASIHPRLTWFPDMDNDGYGTDEFVFACYQPEGHVAIDGDDCDNNADTLVRLTWFRDHDGDGYGDNSSTLLACDQPAGYVDRGGDACDNDASTLVERTWFYDEDRDGFAGTTSVVACEAPRFHYASSTDCRWRCFSSPQYPMV